MDAKSAKIKSLQADLKVARKIIEKRTKQLSTIFTALRDPYIVLKFVTEVRQLDRNLFFTTKFSGHPQVHVSEYIFLAHASNFGPLTLEKAYKFISTYPAGILPAWRTPNQVELRLKRLVKAGYLKRYAANKRILYSITPKGTIFLFDMGDEIRAIITKAAGEKPSNTRFWRRRFKKK